MKKSAFWILMVACLMAFGCSHSSKNAALVEHTFHNTVWERFDYVYNIVELKEPTTFDIDMRISFTDDYPFDYFEMVFTILDSHGDRYRAKGYKFNLKDNDGAWKSPLKDGCHTFGFPINKELSISEPGKYRFQIEYRMPKTPLVGVKEIVLNNNH